MWKGFLYGPAAGLGRDSTDHHQPTTFPPVIRIAISLAAYEAIAASLPKGEARPPEPLKASKDVGVWIDPAMHAAARQGAQGR